MNEKNITLSPEIVSGKCPTCSQQTVLVGLTKDSYRCMTCGTDCIQHINGKINYLPVMGPRDKTDKPYIKEWS